MTAGPALLQSTTGTPFADRKGSSPPSSGGGHQVSSSRTLTPSLLFLYCCSTPNATATATVTSAALAVWK
ncbi:hypothetical protein EGR_07092 [Echinococcus granulosus]|uniref:Uncharacterized protein n=1 Tax=Echinococcus granulosus TaxID=6210 RepID=W6UIW1_ECHGR|nr:hypothetical protein EGR_07092 [Echinococcus granulosus]EUB58072.1 hypothetical protein EGR_07092 [Echinococcus granulosus]